MHLLVFKRVINEDQSASEGKQKAAIRWLWTCRAETAVITLDRQKKVREKEFTIFHIVHMMMGGKKQTSQQM
jgi:hypothetical protein